MKQNICLFGSSKQNATQNSQSVYEIMNIKMPATIHSVIQIFKILYSVSGLYLMDFFLKAPGKCGFNK